MDLRKGKYGLFYACPNFPRCKGTHCAHDDGSPMGIPADEPTKRARGMAHKVFDRLWKEGQYSRTAAYLWMQRVMHLSADEAHIGRFTQEQCSELIRLVWEQSDESALPDEWR